MNMESLKFKGWQDVISLVLGGSAVSLGPAREHGLQHNPRIEQAPEEQKANDM